MKDWSVDRWISVLGFAGVLISGIFFTGMRWNSLDRDVTQLQGEMQRATVALELVTANQWQTTRQLDDVANQLRMLLAGRTDIVPTTQPGPSARFPRDQQFVIAGR